MIKGKARQKNGRTLIVLGLSNENVFRLVNGQPIRVDGDSLREQFDLLLYAGEDEMEMMKELQDAGITLGLAEFSR